MHSKLICAITRDLMNEHNPPMVLPNGAVYSQKAVQMMAAKNHGIFTCPKTGQSTHTRPPALSGYCAFRMRMSLRSTQLL